MATAKEANKCPTCGRIIDRHEIGLSRGMVISLWRIYRWCLSNGRHEFTRKEINPIFQDHAAYSRWGDMIYFGGLVYKPNGKGTFGLNMERCKDFFDGHLKIALKVWKDPVTKETEPFDHGFIHEVPNISEWLDSSGLYRARYEDNGV